MTNAIDDLTGTDLANTTTTIVQGANGTGTASANDASNNQQISGTLTTGTAFTGTANLSVTNYTQNPVGDPTGQASMGSFDVQTTGVDNTTSAVVTFTGEVPTQELKQATLSYFGSDAQWHTAAFNNGSQWVQIGSTGNTPIQEQDAPVSGTNMSTLSLSLDFTNNTVPAITDLGGTVFTLAVPAPVSLSSPTLPDGVAGVAYNQTITGSGGSGNKRLTVSMSGSIPGLTIPAGGTNTLVITGTPTGAGTVNFTVTATDSLGASTSQSYSLTVITADPSHSIISIVSPSISSNSTTTITLTAKGASGNPVTSGGLTVAFGLGAGSGDGIFSSVTDNHNGTYSATFTGITAGTNTITATINNMAVSSSPTITVTPGSYSLSQSIVTVSPASIHAGGTGTVTLFASDGIGNLNPSGGLNVTFSLGNGSASGTFGSVTDNHNGTYTSTFTAGDTIGSNTIIASIGGQTVNSTAPAIAVIPAHFAVSAPSSATAGAPFTITVTAQDTANAKVMGYTGTIHFTKSDMGLASFLPADYTFTLADNGTHTFTNAVSLTTAGTQNITATDSSSVTGSASVTVSAGALNEFVVSAIGGNNLTVGGAFLVTAQAADQFGNPLSNFTGAVTFSTTDPQVPTLPSAMVTNGFGVTLGMLKTVVGGPWTITVAAGSLKGTSGPLTVTPGNAVYFKVDTPATAVTNASFPITVTALDAFSNVASNYSGTVKLSSTDTAATLVGDLLRSYKFTTGAGKDNGVHVFLNVKLLTDGNQKIAVADTAATMPAIIGTSSAIATSGLAVTALTKTPSGFTASFNQPLNPADLTLYGKGTTQQDVLLIGANTNNGQPYPGTLIVDPSKKSVTFNVSSNFLVASNPGGSAALPDDTYTVTLLSGVGSNGFQDISGQGLDNGQGGHADYVGTFTTTYQHDSTEVLGIPDFARGPNASGDTTTLVKVPNDPANGGHLGIPITIYNSAGLTSSGFTLTYNATILTVTGGVSDPSNGGATFQMTNNVMSSDGVHSIATFAFTRAAPTSGTQILGDITAYVPYSARSQYQVKDLLALGNITVNSGATVVPGNAVDVNAYFGDVNGDHHLDGLDKALLANVASTANTGFSAFTLLDPAIVGDLSGDNAVTANSTSLLSNYLLGKTVAKIPALPNPPIGDNLFTSPFAADPTLSLPASVSAARGLANLPIYLDHALPLGSTGLVEAELTVAYDPAVLSVSAADITLGTIPGQGTGWQLSATVNAATGQIAIQLYSQTPITTDLAGSLVNIAFHFKSHNETKPTVVQLVESKTVLADAQAAMILTPGLDWTAVLSDDWTR